MGAHQEIPRDVLTQLRTICAGLPETVEEPAWTGVRWRVGTNTIVHAVMITDGWPPAYAAAAGTNGPMCVITLRCDNDDLAALTATDGPYFRPIWGTRWRHPVLGVRVQPDTNWDEIGQLTAGSYQLLAPRRLM